MRTVSSDGVGSEQVSEVGLPVRVQEALGELAGAAKEGLLALSVGVGLGVLHEIMEADGDARRPAGADRAAAGARGRWDRRG